MEIKKRYFFKLNNKRFKINRTKWGKNYRFFTEGTNFPKDFEKNYLYFYTEQMILLNERFKKRTILLNNHSVRKRTK